MNEDKAMEKRSLASEVNIYNRSWVPERDVPKVKSLSWFRERAHPVKWRVDRKHSRRKEAFPDQPCGRADTEEVNEDKDGCPETPAKASSAVGVGGLGLGLDLVCGLLVHGRSLAQDRRFNRSKAERAEGRPYQSGTRTRTPQRDRYHRRHGATART